MTEQEWLSGEQPEAMLDHPITIGLGEDARLRRFVGTYLNQSRHTFGDEQIAQGWEVVDRFADGKAALAEFSSYLP